MNLMKDTKRTAIVTGAASGIGEAVARALSREGHNLVVADLNEENGLLVAEELEGVFVHVDLSERQSCRDLIDTVLSEFERIDILVNNAGVQHISPLENFPEDTWNLMLSVMLTAPFLLTRYAWPVMKKQEWGRIVNMASVHGLTASPNKAAYVAAKHGLLGLTRASAVEGGPLGITANAVCPSFTRTPLVENQLGDLATTMGISEDEVLDKVLFKANAIKRFLEPEEIADVVVYLASEKARSVTGAVWAIDCGWTA